MRNPRNTLILASLAVLLSSVTALIATAAKTQQAKEPGKTVISVDQVPKAVMQAIQEVVPRGIIEKASTQTEEGITAYETSIKSADGTTRDLKFAESGDVIEITEIITQASLPPAGAKTLETALPGGEITEIEKQIVIAYMVRKTIDGKLREVKMDASGKIINGQKESKEANKGDEGNKKGAK